MKVLDVSGLKAAYGPVRVLHGIAFHVEQGEIVALLGANGAGKTTTLRALSGLLPSTGTVSFLGRDLAGVAAAARVGAGLAQLPQGRGTFTDFTVEENLELGAYAVAERRQIAEDIAKWFEIFPRLAERRRQPAGLLSGGEQQMLAIARALMSRPKLLLCDEPSLGLAPAITQHLFRLLADLNRKDGLSILLVEQNADLTLRIAHRAYVLTAGLISVQGTAQELLGNADVQQAYLGA
jgi:branched-chain amino acid transport system ATP-binding protein